jgi:hypothetical protein
MSIIEQTLKETTLYGWGRGYVLPKVDENPNDIWLLIKYNDHDDGFLVVGTIDGNFYRYGLFANRPFASFILKNALRQPKLYESMIPIRRYKLLDNVEYTVGIIGEAGKERVDYDELLIGDEFGYVIVNNKKIDPNKVTSHWDTDEWGVESVYLSLKGFRPSQKR